MPDKNTTPAKPRIAIEIAGQRFVLVSRKTSPFARDCRACHARRYCKRYLPKPPFPSIGRAIPLCFPFLPDGSTTFWVFKRQKEGGAK